MAKKKPDKEPFARIPEHVMQSEALMSAPHAAFRVLAILLMGKAKERNGTMMCTDTYAAKFGMTSRETVYRSLQALEERGLIVRTRQGMKLRKVPTLWAVTWWPIYYLEGKPLDYPKDATNAYLQWKPTAEIHTDSRCDVTPIVGVEGTPLHTDLPPESTSFHTDSREYSKSLGRGPRDGRDLPAPDSLLNPPPKAGGRISNIDERIRKARKHLAADPNADSATLARMYRLTSTEVQQLKASA